MGISAAIAEKEIFNRLAVRTITRWDVLPGEAMEALSLEILREFGETSPRSDGAHPVRQG